jgi:hypothetical protein
MTGSGHRRPKIDPELKKQLASASASNEAVGAVFRLRAPDPDRVFPTPEEATGIAERLVAELSETPDVRDFDYHVLPNVGVLIVSAAPDLIRRFLDRDEIASATANRQPGALLIRPRKKRRVD